MGHSRQPFLYFLSFLQTINSKKMFNKSCQWLDLNPGPLVSEATALPTAPQPLPSNQLQLLSKLSVSLLLVIFDMNSTSTEIIPKHRRTVFCWNKFVTFPLDMVSPWNMHFSWSGKEKELSLLSNILDVVLPSWDSSRQCDQKKIAKWF